LERERNAGSNLFMFFMILSPISRRWTATTVTAKDMPSLGGDNISGKPKDIEHMEWPPAKGTVSIANR
jgi:hypothetical protein